jgi:hypothetical protein
VCCAARGVVRSLLSACGCVGRTEYQLLCRDEIRQATSSMTSVPKPLKFMRPHYEGMKAFFQEMMDSDLKILFSEVLSVLGMTMAG